MVMGHGRPEQHIHRRLLATAATRTCSLYGEAGHLDFSFVIWGAFFQDGYLSKSRELQGVNIFFLCHRSGPAFGNCLRIVAIRLRYRFGGIYVAHDKATVALEDAVYLLPDGLFVIGVIDGTVGNDQIRALIAEWDIFKNGFLRVLFYRTVLPGK